MGKYLTRYTDAYNQFRHLPIEAQRQAAQQVITLQEKARAERWAEIPWSGGGSNPFDDESNPYMMLLGGYTDFWSIIGGADAALAFDKGVTAAYEGSHPLYVCESHNASGLPSSLLVELFYPQAAIRRPLQGDENLLSFERARRLIGYEPQHRLADFLQELA
jgi:hypothetical protein